MTDISLPSWIIWFSHFCVIVVFLTGFLCFLLRKEFIRQLFGLKLMLQSISLGLITAGWQMGDLYVSQSMVISALIIEAIVIGLALTMIVHISKHPKDDLPLFSHIKRKEKTRDG